MNWLDKLERRFGKLAIPGLMKTVIAGMALVFCCNLLFPSVGLLDYLTFVPERILRGEVWRIFTFVFLPPSSSIIWIVFALYFYYMIGTALERQWGSFKFTFYYLLGVIGAIISGFISGYATNDYLNMSLFFAFAAIYPDMQVLLFFIIPIKVKWLALFDGVFFLFYFITGTMQTRLSIVASLINFFIFFGPSLFRTIRTGIENNRRRSAWRDQMRR